MSLFSQADLDKKINDEVKERVEEIIGSDYVSSQIAVKIYNQLLSHEKIELIRFLVQDLKSLQIK